MRKIENVLLRRWIVMIAGILVMGFAVALARIADFGTDPCTTMNLGISGTLMSSGVGWMTFGTYQLIFNVLLLIVTFFFDKRLIGAATFVNMIFVGYISDFFVWIYSGFSFEAPIWLRVLILLFFIPLGSLACSMYMSADLGASPYDGVAPVIVKLSKERLSFRVARFISDAVCVAVGFAFGATVGIGTLLMVATAGPLMQFFNGKVKSFIYTYAS